MRARLVVEVTSDCVVNVARPTLVLVIAALLAHALDAVGSMPPNDARIAIRASEHDDAVLVEIAHNGRAIPPDLRPTLLDPYFAMPASGVEEVSIAGLRKRVRSVGGEVLVLSEAGTTTLRLVLPLADATASASVTEPSPPLHADDMPASSRRSD
jgi:C4-dicarboxylate-specific signal transduction histidine kinase